MTEKRDTSVGRTNILGSVRERLWGRSAARCVLCSIWLINGEDYWHSISTSEVAHNVGATNGANSPRGDSDLSIDERAHESNLLLLCHECHRKIDSVALRDEYSVEFLTAMKLKHETRVREVTDFATLVPATVVRLTAAIRGTMAPVSVSRISEALRMEGLTGMGEDTRNGLFDISLPDAETETHTWARAKFEIDKEVTRVLEAFASGDSTVLGVFAMGPVPILIYFGSRLDDKTETILFGGNRTDGPLSWSWPVEAAETPQFHTVVAGASTGEERAVVVLVSVSADLDRARIPDELRELPIVELRPTDRAPSPDLIDSRSALNALAQEWRATLSLIESRWPSVRQIHLIAAVPVTAAVSLGRHHMRDSQPELILYQRRETGLYEPVMKVGS